MGKVVKKSSAPVKEYYTGPYPSPFGSHLSMVDLEETAKLNDPNLVVLKDNAGFYVTERNRLDSGLADPNRYGKRTMFRRINEN